MGEVVGGELQDLGVHAPSLLPSTSLCCLGFVPSGQLPKEKTALPYHLQEEKPQRKVLAGS